MEAPQPGSRGLGQRRGGRDAPLYFGIRSNVSRAQASSAHRPPKFAGLRARRFAGWLSFRAPHSLDLQGGRPVSEIADSLDVVAARRRAGRWFGRHDFPASAWRRLRHDCHAAPRRGDHQSDPRRALGEMVYLGGVARLRHFGRSTGAVADDGRGARRTRSDVPPHEGAGFWPLVSMGATLGGTMRAPFTRIIFAFELTQDSSILLPLLIASVVSHTFTVLTLKRSILTEKVARRGYHLSSEYAVDPLEILFARDVMRTKVAVLPASSSLSEFQKALTDHRQSQRLLPVVDGDGVLVGVVTRGDIYKLFDQGDESLLRRPLRDAVHRITVEAYPDEPLRSVVCRMVDIRITRVAAVDAGTRKFLGLIALDDLLKARARHLEEEKRREQVLSLRVFLPGGGGQEETETQDQAETRAAS